MPRGRAVWADLLDRVETWSIRRAGEADAAPGLARPAGADELQGAAAGVGRGFGGRSRRTRWAAARLSTARPKARDDGRPCVAFTANPYYGARAGKAGLPRIRGDPLYRYLSRTTAIRRRPQGGAGRGECPAGSICCWT